jgi:UDPglucose 6-dehydrogenase
MSLNPATVIFVFHSGPKSLTDDVREAPALALIEALLHRGASVRATDPAALKTAEAYFGACGAHGAREGLRLCAGAYEAAQEADALLLCTEWRQYRQPDFRRLRKIMAGTGIFDGRNVWDPEQVRELGFHYHGIGRPI